MKKTILLVMVIVSFTACKKDNSTSVSKTALLCGSSSKKWKVTGYQRSINSPITASTADKLSTLASTYTDNLMVFYPNGVEKMNEGATGTNPLTDYTTANWVFMDNETSINCQVLFGILGNGDEQLNCSFTELSSQKMVLDNTFIFGTTTYYSRWTLVPAN